MKSIGVGMISVVRRPAVWIPAVVLAAATVAFWSTDLDVALVRPFFSGYVVPHDGGIREFPLGQAQPWKGLYDWGPIPAWILGVGGLLVWVASFVWKRLRPWRDPGLFYVLLLIIGPGILVNCVFKPFWSRPRPQATTAFGVDRHLSGGLAARPRRRRLLVSQRTRGDGLLLDGAGVCLLAAAALAGRRVCAARATSGAVIGLARMVAGGHFPSDILWAGGIVYFTALALAAPFRFGRVVSS